MFSVVNVYLDHLKFCVVCINGLSKCKVVSNEFNEPTPCRVQSIGMHGGEVMYFVCFCFRGELGFLNCDDICIIYYMYVDLQYDDISLTFTVGSMCFCGVCSNVIIFGLSVMFSWYHMWIRW